MVLRPLLVSLLLTASFGAVSQETAGSAIPRKAAAVTDFKEAQLLLAAGRLDQAIAAVEEGLSQAPRSVVGHNLLGVIYNQQSKYDEAVLQFQKALAIAPNSVETLVNLAISYVNQNKAELSAQMLRKALRIQPGNRTGNYNLGNLLLSQNAAKQALPYLRRVADPDAATRLLIVRAYMEAGMSAAGLSSAERLSRDFPKDARIHYSLGVLLAPYRNTGRLLLSLK